MKKLLCLFLMCLLFAGTMQETKASAFYDVADQHAQYAEISYLYKNNVLSNKVDYFKPKEAMTRQDFTVMLVKSLGYKDVAPTNTSFQDVTKSNAASGYIQIAVNKGIVKGYSNGTFGPNEKLNRGHAATFLSRTYNFKAGTKTFKDVTKSHTAYSAIQQLVGANVANGYEDGTFRPNNTLTRAHAAAFLARTMKYFSGEKFPLTEEDALNRLRQKGYWPKGYTVMVHGLEDGIYTIQVAKDMGTHFATYDWYEVDQATGLIEPMFGEKVKHNLTKDQARRLLYNEGYLPKNATITDEFVVGTQYVFRANLSLQETSMTFWVDRYMSEVEMDM